MGIHMNLDYNEPAKGDFVALIDAMVGPPPEDPEMSGKEIAARMVARAEHNRQLSEMASNPGDAPTITTTEDGPPDIADALESSARTGIRSLVILVAGILILAGIGLFLINIYVPDLIPGLQPQYAAGAFFAGLILRNIAS